MEGLWFAAAVLLALVFIGVPIVCCQGEDDSYIKNVGRCCAGIGTLIGVIGSIVGIIREGHDNGWGFFGYLFGVPITTFILGFVGFLCGTWVGLIFGVISFPFVRWRLRAGEMMRRLFERVRPKAKSQTV